MNVRYVALLGLLSALWIFGLAGQLNNGEPMKYLAISAAAVAGLLIWNRGNLPALPVWARKKKPPRR